MATILAEGKHLSKTFPVKGQGKGAALHAVSGVDLAVYEGETLALVGESGSGKSTLAKLLVHYYDVTGGSIRVGGQDIREMSVEALNDQISYVAQEQFLFNMSLLENIRLGRPEATDQEVLAAAEKAQETGETIDYKRYVHAVPSKPGTQVMIPAGTIHAICRGIVVAEVQQSSNVTYRVCDYGRLGPDGKPRALHIAQALDVTRRTAGVPTPDFGGHLARCGYFTVDLLAAPQATLCGTESFLSLLIFDGEGEVRCGGETVRARKGDSLFLPAGSGEVRLTGTLRALATRI